MTTVIKLYLDVVNNNSIKLYMRSEQTKKNESMLTTVKQRCAHQFLCDREFCDPFIKFRGNNLQTGIDWEWMKESDSNKTL